MSPTSSACASSRDGGDAPAPAVSTDASDASRPAADADFNSAGKTSSIDVSDASLKRKRAGSDDGDLLAAKRVDGGDNARDDDDTVPLQKPPPPPTVSATHVDFPLPPVNPHLICPLCNGYYRDPYTVTECLHTFCKSCLFFAFRSGYRRCPDCEISLEPDPFREVLSDRTLHELVNKIFPQLRERDEAEERDFYRRRGIRLKPEFAEEEREREGAAEAAGGGIGAGRGVGSAHSGQDSRSGGATVTAEVARVAEDELDFALEPDTTVQIALQMPQLQSPVLRTSGRLKVSQLKKYLLKKLKLKANPAAVEILCNGDPLGDELSLTFIQRTRWLHPTEDLTLNYRFGEGGLY